MLTFVLAIAPLLSFADVFMADTVYCLPPEVRVSGERETSSWSYCTVSPDGASLTFIDPKGNDIRRYRFAQDSLSLVISHTDLGAQSWFDSTETVRVSDGRSFARVVERPRATDSTRPARPETTVQHGRGRDNVNVPVAVSYDADGRLLVSDLGSRRVSVFDVDGGFASSFILGPHEDTPFDIGSLKSGNLVCANLRLDRKGRFNSGYHCNIYSPTGALQKSFAYTPKSATERNLWAGVSSVMDVDTRGNVYVAFSTDPSVHVFDTDGQKTRTLGEVADWFVFPSPLPAPIHERDSPPNGFTTSWTRLIKLSCIDTTYVIRTALTNGLVEGTSDAFLMEVLAMDGSGGTTLTSNSWPVGTDGSGHVYFLSLKGDLLTRARLIGVTHR